MLFSNICKDNGKVRAHGRMSEFTRDWMSGYIVTLWPAGIVPAASVETEVTSTTGRMRLTETGQAWEQTIQQIAGSQEGSLDLWLGQVECVGVEDHRLVLRVPNEFTREWISERYVDRILEGMKGELPGLLSVRFVLDGPAFERALPGPAQVKVHAFAPGQPVDATAGMSINPRFTFEEFVEGPENRLALAACMGLVANPGSAISPLFIYGPSGVGKTHLINAVHHALGGRTPSGPVLYLPSEAFMNDFLDSLKAGTMHAFRDRYRRQCGMLLIDDIQFIASREKTQEEFFHLFNELYNTGKPVVITSDRPPRALVKIEGRLRSRLEWGLMADMRSPEMEMRMAIARRKAEGLRLALLPEVIDLVAAAASGSVREIEGALIRLDVQSSIERCEITVDMARKALGVIGVTAPHKLNADDVIRQVAATYGLKVSDLKGTKRNRSVSLPRQVAMYLCREVLGMSYPEIGESFGGRDHTTIINGCRKITGLLDTDGSLQSTVDAIRRQITRQAA